MKVTVATDEVFYQGDFADITKYSVGIYVVEVRTWTENSIDTGYFKEMSIEIIDPCLSHSFFIDDSVFK